MKQEGLDREHISLDLTKSSLDVNIHRSAVYSDHIGNKPKAGTEE